MKKRVFGIVAIAALAISATAAPAAAFEPPADPQNKFTCDGGPVAGHPGTSGLSIATALAASPAAWSATNDPDGPVITCD